MSVFDVPLLLVLKQSFDTSNCFPAFVLSPFRHFTISFHNQLVGGSTAMVVTTAGALRLLPKIERGLPTELMPSGFPKLN